MRFLTLTAALTLSLAPAACGDDGTAANDGSSGSSGSGSGTTTMPLPMTTEQQTTNSWTSAGSSTGDSTVGPIDSSDSGTTAASNGSTGSTGDTGEPEPLYPPCDFEMDPVCTKPYMDCYEFAAPEFSACTSPCEVDEDCPQPLTGDAPAVCAGQMFDQCLLDCAGGATCPDGMECVPIAGGMFNRCLWPAG
ncbi:MAG: hypothetical protein AB1Z98_06950 [Nannocystaceae bacterium]